MTKYLALFLLLLPFIVSFGFGSNATARKNQSAPINPIATPKPLAEIEKLELDRNELTYICPYFDNCGKDENFLIQVKTTVRNPKKVPLIYQYTVSGGRIIGQGEKVFWDLNRVRPGTYTITVAIDYGRGFSYETKSENVTVGKCPVCDMPCFCPTIFSVIGSENARAGETITFTANVSGGTAFDLAYNWTVSQGEIVEGQGTPEITVKTTKEMTGTIEATVEIGGGSLCDVCLRTKSKTIEIIK